MTKRQYFGTDGIRARVGSRLMNAEFMMKLGWAAGSVLAKEKNATVLIGHDTRQSADMLESALQSGLTAAGVNVKLLGTLPTPAIAYLTHSLRAQAGIVISASHNAYQDNGIKFFNHQGMKLSDEMELAIEAELEKNMQTVESDRLGKVE
ncbi:MAG: phosphoglucosamine mutase, partial [Coxiellaceae bacterium]|nr:phosphoglucosamine mutase [Coxiellaceae bacterium]